MSTYCDVHCVASFYYHYFFFCQAFQTFDAEKTHTITQSEFKRALESFCIPLTEDQFEQLLRKVKELIKINILISNFRSSSQLQGYPYLPQGGSLEVPRGEVSKVKNFKVKHGARLPIMPGGVGWGGGWRGGRGI